MKKPKKHVHRWSPTGNFNEYIDSGTCSCGKAIWEVYSAKFICRILNRYERLKAKEKK